MAKAVQVARPAIWVLAIAVVTQALAQDVEAVSCQIADESGGNSELVIDLQEDRIHAFRYRRSEGLPRCEIEASRSSSQFAWQRFDWIDDAEASEVFIISDEIHTDAHLRLIRRGQQIELRVLSYDRRWLCGMGQYLHPVIVWRQGEETCSLGP